MTNPAPATAPTNTRKRSYVLARLDISALNRVLTDIAIRLDGVEAIGQNPDTHGRKVVNLGTGFRTRDAIRFDQITSFNDHLTATDPHDQYQKESEKDQENGYAGLNGSTRVVKGSDSQDDTIIDLATKGVVLKDTQAPAHYWRVIINNAGALVTTDLGVMKP